MNLVPLKEADTEKLGMGALIGSSAEDLTCYFGYRPPGTKIDIFCYHLCAGFRSREQDDSLSFIKLENGALLWTYKPESIFSECYHASDFHVALPSGTQCYYAIRSRGRDERAATEKTFGFVQEDLEDLLQTYCTAMGVDEDGAARVTFSKTRNNDCDLTGVNIPSNFPYITFAGSGFIWSHVSLYGFYCHLALLLHKGKRSRFYELMIDGGAKEEWLSRVRELPSKTVGSRITIERLV